MRKRRGDVQNSETQGKCVKCFREADDTFVRTEAHDGPEQNRGRLKRKKD